MKTFRYLLHTDIFISVMFLNVFNRIQHIHPQSLFLENTVFKTYFFCQVFQIIFQITSVIQGSDFDIVIQIIFLTLFSG